MPRSPLRPAALAALLTAVIAGPACDVEPSVCRASPARCQLALTLEREVTPAGVTTAVRPDSARLGSATYLGFTNRDQPQSLGLFSLDDSLSALGRRMIAGSGTQADVTTNLGLTDLRLTSDGKQTIWVGFESVVMAQPGTSQPNRNCLNFAAYRVGAGATLALAASGEVFCSEWSASAPAGGVVRAPPGTVLPDDPVPLYDEGKYYLLTRKQDTAVVPVHVFDASFVEQSSFELDLRAVTGNLILSVYSVLRVNGILSLLGALYDGPPSESGRRSYLILIPLRDDLRAASGALITLSQTSDYQAYVSGARCDDGKLYVTHNIHSRQIGGVNKGVLKVFDAKHDLALLADVVINAGTPSGEHFRDDHLTVEVIAGKAFVFYPSPDDKLWVKAFQWVDD